MRTVNSELVYTTVRMCRDLRVTELMYTTTCIYWSLCLPGMYVTFMCIVPCHTGLQYTTL